MKIEELPIGSRMLMRELREPDCKVHEVFLREVTPSKNMVKVEDKDECRKKWLKSNEVVLIELLPTEPLTDNDEVVVVKRSEYNDMIKQLGVLKTELENLKAMKEFVKEEIPLEEILKGPHVVEERKFTEEEGKALDKEPNRTWAEKPYSIDDLAERGIKEPDLSENPGNKDGIEDVPNIEGIQDESKSTNQ